MNRYLKLNHPRTSERANPCVLKPFWILGGDQITQSSSLSGMSTQLSAVSNIYSSETLTDGLDHVLAQSRSADEEAALLKELEDFQTSTMIPELLLQQSCMFRCPANMEKQTLYA